ncbi:unnamed protein product [Adineta steineri]|uniref:Uncharacterized protein n=1 Tax=Adineta steineri TaxID=433720 RepID=A0A813NQU1_9BILA|nr:unnamed protein product [Adineta steineri]CAF0770644.1 unnamed protein product [Adineta steineri]
MNVSSAALVFPINHQDHRRRVLTNNHSKMFINASPVAVSNKIKAIQTRRPRITLPSYYDFTDIRPLHFGNSNGITNSLTSFSNLSPEKLIEHSKDLRLSRISARRNPRPSGLSNTSTANQQSLIWSSYNAPTSFPKQSQTNVPIPPGLPNGKPSPNNMPDISRRPSRAQTTSRQPFTDQENSLVPVESRHKSLTKTKPSIPKAYHRTTPKSKSPFPTSQTQRVQTLNNDNTNTNTNTNCIPLCESEDDDEDIPMMDEEFEEYLQKALVKCADWLIKYVIDKKYDENNE